jgi:hypothetical protein
MLLHQLKKHLLFLFLWLPPLRTCRWLPYCILYLPIEILFINFRNVLLVNSSADHLKVGDFGLSKLIKVQNSHDVYKMTGETGSCECL